MLPLISAIFLSLLLTLLVYLFYARDPVNVEITLSENASLAYQGGKNKNDSFGFLNEKRIVRNTISPLSRDDKTKKMECYFSQIDGSKKEVLVDGKYLTGLLIKVYPDDVILFKDSPSFDVKSDFSLFKKEYVKNDVIFNDISNGSLSSLHGKGFSSLLINGHDRPIKNETEILITNGNLVGFVTKDKKIKINGDADLLFIDDKIMNLRKISVLQSKLAILNSSLSEFIKYFFGTSVFLLILKFLHSYFKKDVVENFLD